MRQRDIRALPLPAGSADGFVQRRLAPVALDRELSEEHDPARPHQLELPLEPGRAQGDLRRRRAAVTGAARRLPREALGDGRAVGQLACVETRLGEPGAEGHAGPPAERSVRQELDRPRRLADDHDPVARAARDDRLRTLDVSSRHAPRARSDLRVQASEGIHDDQAKMIVRERGVA